MSDENSKVKDLSVLLNQFLDGSITDAELAALELEIRENPAARRLLLEYSQIHIDLAVDTSIDVGADRALGEFRRQQQQLAAVVSKAPLPLVFGFPGNWPQLNRPVVFMLGILFAFVGSALWFRANPGQPSWEPIRSANSEVVTQGQLPSSSNSNPAPVAAAYLMSANGCNWNNSSLLYTVGSSIEVGSEVSLSEGIAEFRLANGVYFSVEGPASLILASTSTLVLQYGKLTTHVPWTASDFKTIAGACKFSARDAEFGVSHDGSRIEVHVFSGAVQAASPQAAATDPATVIEGGAIVVDELGVFTVGTVTAGNALSLRGEGGLLKMASVLGQVAKPELFAAKLPMAGALPIPRSYVNAVLASKPIGYWRFEKVTDGVFANEIQGGSSLSLVGDLRLMGRVGNSAVEFQPNSKAHLVSKSLSELANSDYSLEVWMKASHLHRGTVLSLYAPNAHPSHATSIELQGPDSFPSIKNPPGVVRYVHDSPSGSKTSCFSKQLYHIRRWQHLVAVKEGSRMRLYVDGKLSNTRRDSTNLVPDLHLMLGWMPLTPDRGFVGQVDEAAIYNRALTDKEISRHYEIVEDAVHLPSEFKSTLNDRFHDWSRAQKPVVLATVD